MCAVRFGSYSMRSTRAGDAFLVALEVDDAVMLLVAAADVTGGDAAVVVAATGACSASRSARAYGAPLCRPGVTTRTIERRPGEVGLNVINAMGASPQALADHVDRLAFGQRTYALRQSPRVPARNGRPCALPFTFTTLTASTLTLNSFSTARLDVGLGRVLRDLEDVLVELPAGARSSRTRAAHG